MTLKIDRHVRDRHAPTTRDERGQAPDPVERRTVPVECGDTDRRSWKRAA
jgi:hypothetical protein